MSTLLVTTQRNFLLKIKNYIFNLAQKE